MPGELAVYDKPMDIAEMRRQVNLVQGVMQEFMKVDEHYGIIPGCKKPSLYKAGAEKLCMVFRMDPHYAVDITNMDKGHREVTITCTLFSIGSGIRLGSGVGSASTMEAKYRYRDMQKQCPECGKETIIKGKAEYGGGWLCFAKKGGCGAKFKEDDPAIKEQIVGKIEYDNPADFFNTVLKMAKKRAHTDAVLTVTATSDIFAQDIVDEQEEGPNGHPLIDDPAAIKEQVATALVVFKDRLSEKKPTAAQMIQLEKFLACYKTPEEAEQVKAQASSSPARFDEFWGWFLVWCAKNANSGKKATTTPRTPPKIATNGQDQPEAPPGEATVSPAGIPRAISEEQLQNITYLVGAKGYETQVIFDDYEVSSLEELNFETAHNIVKMLAALPNV